MEHYGLLALYFGMWAEGETVLVIAGFLVHQHMLHRWEALPVAILGALSVDHALFFAGRYASGFRFLKRLKERASATRMAKLGDSFIVFMSVRYVYGTRSPYMFLVGAHGLRWPKFIVREIPAVVSWCIIWLFFGQAFGNVMTVIYGRLHKAHLPWIVLSLAVSGLSLAAYVVLKRRQRRKLKALQGEGDD